MGGSDTWWTGPTILTSRPWTVHIDSASDAIAENHLIVSDFNMCDEGERPESMSTVVAGSCRELQMPAGELERGGGGD